MTQIEDYACWRSALAGESVERFAKQPHCGFWRKGKSGDPVAVWREEDGGKLVARVGGKAARYADSEFDETVFGFCLPNPISHETYTAVMRGESWPGTDDVVAAQIGDNSQNADEAEALRDQIAAAVEQAKGYASVADDETAAKAQSLRARLVELRGEVEVKHRSEKEPHLKAGREVDAKWLPIAKQADGAAATIRSALSKHETDKARRAAEEHRKRQEVQAAASSQRPGAPKAALPPPEPPAKPTPIRGGYGRAAGVRIVKVATIVDQDAAYMALRENVEVVALIKKLADKVIAAGATLPGVEVSEERKVA